MKNIFVFLFALLRVFVIPADEPAPEDFDGAMVYSGGEGSLLSLEIPEEVYRGSRRPDLGDIRIFDSAERPVPFIARKRPVDFFIPPDAEVPFFVWNGESDFPSGADIEINTSGSIIKIKNKNPPRENPLFFLVDFASLEYVPSTLKVEIENNGRNFNTPVSLYYSGDLSNWKTFEKKQILASFGGNVRDILELPVLENAKYLLLGFAAGVPPPARMTAAFTSREKPAPLRETLIKGVLSADGKKSVYETGGFFPVESLDFILAEADSVPVLIKSRLNEDDEWTVLGRETIYRYNSPSGTVKNPPFKTGAAALYANRAPFWELENEGTLPFNAAPDMLICWNPEELVFPARGKGPWTLSYGNPGCPPLGAASIPLPENGEGIESAVFTGEKRYTKSAAVSAGEKNYRVIFLWSFLGLAVLILLFLSYTIARSMKR